MGKIVFLQNALGNKIYPVTIGDAIAINGKSLTNLVKEDLLPLDIAELMESGSSDLTVQDLVNHHLYWADSHVQLVKGAHEMYLVAETLPETPTGDNVKIQRAVYLVQDSDSGVTVQFVGNSYIGLSDLERSSYESAVDSVTQLLTDVEELQLHVINLNYHEYVDLGLPSGTLWATCNVGANSPEEYGDYYAWGETETKDEYNWSTYLDNPSGDGETFTKYAVDTKTQLDPEDDVAHVKWGGDWRMPTDAELTELRTKCTWTWTTQNGVNGRKVTGPNGNSIFLPAAGLRDDSDLYYAGSRSFYWSSSLDEDDLDLAYELYFNSSTVGMSGSGRDSGLSVRPVCSIAPSKYIDDAVVAVKENITEIKESISDLEDHIKVETPYDYVDLGLPSGTLWATRNVGAYTPTEYGNYYAWGETETKSDYSWSTYFDSINGSDSDFNKYGRKKKTILEPCDDVACTKLGGNWRIPTKEECTELCTECSWEIIQSSIFKITGPNGNYILIPSGGLRIDNLGQGGGFALWTSEHSGSESGTAQLFIAVLEADARLIVDRERKVGANIRPVCKSPYTYLKEFKNVTTFNKYIKVPSDGGIRFTKNGDEIGHLDLTRDNHFDLEGGPLDVESLHVKDNINMDGSNYISIGGTPILSRSNLHLKYPAAILAESDLGIEGNNININAGKGLYILTGSSGTDSQASDVYILTEDFLVYKDADNKIKLDDTGFRAQSSGPLYLRNDENLHIKLNPSSKDVTIASKNIIWYQHKLNPETGEYVEYKAHLLSEILENMATLQDIENKLGDIQTILTNIIGE